METTVRRTCRVGAHGGRVADPPPVRRTRIGLTDRGVSCGQGPQLTCALRSQRPKPEGSPGTPGGKQRPFRAFARKARVRGGAAQFSASLWALRATQKPPCLPYENLRYGSGDSPAEALRPRRGGGRDAVGSFVHPWQGAADFGRRPTGGGVGVAGDLAAGHPCRESGPQGRVREADSSRGRGAERPRLRSADRVSEANRRRRFLGRRSAVARSALRAQPGQAAQAPRAFLWFLSWASKKGTRRRSTTDKLRRSMSGKSKPAVGRLPAVPPSPGRNT